MYLSRSELRKVSQMDYFYEVCVKLDFIDPLKLHQYYVARRVFAATDGMERDETAKSGSYKAACKVLEDHLDLPRNTVKDRRTTKRKTKRLPLTCPTPEWIEKYLQEDPILYSD